MSQRVFIASPVYATVDVHFHRCMLEFVRTYKGEFAVATHAGECPVGRARNSLTAQFLKSDCTDLMFIDSDLIFSAEHVRRLVSHDAELVGGLYPKKQDGDIAFCINGADGYNPEVTPEGLCEVRYIGTGFMRIKRSLFEKMIRAYGAQIVYTTDADNKSTEFDFWQMGVYEYPNGHRRWLSEDWWFCQMAHDLGVKVWADQHVILRHSGHCVYPMAHQEKMALEKGHIRDPRYEAQAQGDTAGFSLVSPEDQGKRILFPQPA